MDDRKIETLLATIRRGSFSKAAEELCCTQSAVTQAMNAIESELGFKILERNHNGIKLTQKGEELLPYIIAVETSMKNLFDEASSIAAGRTRPIRIGAFSSIANTWLPDMILKYEALHPDISFDISIGTNDLVKWMLDGNLDMAIGDEERIKAFRWYPLLTENYMAIMPKDWAPADTDTITQEDFAKYNFIMAKSILMDTKLDKHSVKQTIVRTDDDYTLVSMVSQGLGVTFIPQLSLKSMPHLPENVVVLNLNPAPTRTMGIGLVNNPSRAVVDFKNFLKENIDQI